MKLKASGLAIIIIVLYFGGIFLSSLAGFWKTEGSKNAGVIEKGNSIGQKNPKDIKGSFSFNDIDSNFGISPEELGKAFEIKNVESIGAFKCKDLESYYGEDIDREIGTNSIRYFVALYKGIEFELTEETYLPEGAVNILKEKGNLTKENLDYIEKHTVIVR